MYELRSKFLEGHISDDLAGQLPPVINQTAATHPNMRREILTMLRE